MAEITSLQKMTNINFFSNCPFLQKKMYNDSNLSIAVAIDKTLSMRSNTFNKRG